MVEMYDCLTWEMDDISLKMKATYASQRTDINSGMSNGFNELKIKWPFLFEPIGLMIHCEEQLSFNVCDHVSDSLAFKGQRIIAYVSTLKNKQVSATLAAMNHAKGLLSSSELEAPAIILCVLQVLSEESTTILKLCEVSITCIVISNVK